MKKLIPIALSLILILALSACGNGNSGVEDDFSPPTDKITIDMTGVPNSADFEIYEDILKRLSAQSDVQESELLEEFASEYGMSSGDELRTWMDWVLEHKPS